MESVEDEVAGGDADGLEGVVRRGGVDFVLPVEGEMQRRIGGTRD